MATEGDRINRMEDQLIDMRLAVSALLETVTIHQHNFEVIIAEMRDIRAEIRDIRADMQEMRTDMQEMRADMQEMRTDMQEMRTDMQEMRADMLQMQSEIRGLQTENSRILDVLQNRHPEGDS